MLQQRHSETESERTSGTTPDASSLDLADLEARLRVAFLARYGTDIGAEVTAEAMAWACEHLDELAAMENPAGYLYRVGQSRSRRLLRWQREPVALPPERAVTATPWTEPQLPDALASLGEEERTAVILIHCFQWTYQEVGDLLDLPVSTIGNRVRRGLARLRKQLGAEA
ncbi:MAG: sigma-70 family RNA polymerase sigma factor [Actinomycetota bacterium]